MHQLPFVANFDGGFSFGKLQQTSPEEQAQIKLAIICGPEPTAGATTHHGFGIFACDGILDMPTTGFEIFPPFGLSSGQLQLIV